MYLVKQEIGIFERVEQAVNLTRQHIGSMAKTELTFRLIKEFGNFILDEGGLVFMFDDGTVMQFDSGAEIGYG